MHNAMFKASGSHKSLTLYVGVKSKLRTSLFCFSMLKQKKRETGAKKLNILIFRLVNIVNE